MAILYFGLLAFVAYVIVTMAYKYVKKSFTKIDVQEDIQDKVPEKPAGSGASG